MEPGRSLLTVRYHELFDSPLEVSAMTMLIILKEWFKHNPK